METVLGAKPERLPVGSMPGFAALAHQGRSPQPSYLQLLIFLLLVCTSTQEGSVGSANVSSTDQLVAALEAGATTVLLQGDLSLTQSNSSPYKLPIVLNRSVTITSAVANNQQVLDFGGLLECVYLETDSHLHFKNVELKNLAPAWRGYRAGLRTEVSGSPLWPTVGGAAGHQVSLEGVNLSTFQTVCTPEAVSAISKYMQEDQGLQGSVEQRGKTIVVNGSLALVTPVLKEGVTVGLARYTYSSFSSTCIEDPSAGEQAAPQPSPAPVPASEAGSGSVGWVWTVLGTLLGLAAGCAAMLGLFMVRRWRQRSLAVAGASRGEADSGKGAPSGSTERQASAETGQSLEQDLEEGLGSESDRSNLEATLRSTKVGSVEGLEIGQLLGRGSYGCCYRGRWKGCCVAVKVIQTVVKPGQECDVSREPLISVYVSHPNLVSTFKVHFVSQQKKEEGSSLGAASQFQQDAAPEQAASLDDGSMEVSPAGRQGGSGGFTSAGASPAPSCSGIRTGGNQQMPPKPPSDGSVGSSTAQAHQKMLPGLHESWLIMEYCDRDNLSEAIAAGKFKTPRGELDLVPALLSLCDIASGMEYLHACDICHGDLKGANVLLKSARNDRRGYICKIADFGLSRLLGHQTSVHTESRGTCTHAAPELLEHGTCSKKADVFAFAIIMWEMVAGRAAHHGFHGMTELQIILQVIQHGYRPDVPPHCPPLLAQLMQRCWDADPKLRPEFAQVAQELRAMLREIRKSLDLPTSGTPPST